MKTKSTTKKRKTTRFNPSPELKVISNKIRIDNIKQWGKCGEDEGNYVRVSQVGIWDATYTASEFARVVIGLHTGKGPVCFGDPSKVRECVPHVNEASMFFVVRKRKKTYVYEHNFKSIEELQERAYRLMLRLQFGSVRWHFTKTYNEITYENNEGGKK